MDTGGYVGCCGLRPRWGLLPWQTRVLTTALEFPARAPGSCSGCHRGRRSRLPRPTPQIEGIHPARAAARPRVRLNVVGDLVAFPRQGRRSRDGARARLRPAARTVHREHGLRSPRGGFPARAGHACARMGRRRGRFRVHLRAGSRTRASTDRGQPWVGHGSRTSPPSDPGDLRRQRRDHLLSDRGRDIPLGPHRHAQRTPLRLVDDAAARAPGGSQPAVQRARPVRLPDARRTGSVDPARPTPNRTPARTVRRGVPRRPARSSRHLAPGARTCCGVPCGRVATPVRTRHGARLALA